MTKPELSPGQVRFLREYAWCVQIAPAARRAGIHRATAHRWAKVPTFARAKAAAADAFFAALRVKVRAAEAERQRRREQRELDRRPQRRATLEQNAGYTWGAAE